jgi:hypothetical protein
MRLVRARQRLTAVCVARRDETRALQQAEVCWALCLELLAETDGTADFDAVAGLVVGASGAVGPAFADAGRDAEAYEIQRVSHDVAERAQGPRGRQARARLALGRLSDQTPEFGFVEGADLSQALSEGYEAVDALREHATEGPYEAADLAQMLLVVSRLEMIAEHLPEAAADLDEAIAVITPVAGTGPVTARLATTLRDLRDNLRGHSNAAAGLPDEHAFLRASAELGDGADHQFPPALARASLLVAAFEPHDARRGLAMAWHAAMLTVGGRALEAQDEAEAAVRQLRFFAGDPVRVQAALVVTLRILATAAEWTADANAAQRAETQSAVLRAQLRERDPDLLEDLLR